MIIRWFWFLLSVLGAVALVVAPFWARAETKPIGEAKVVVHIVEGVLDAAPRSIVINDPVFWRELIKTGADSSTKIKFQDDTTLSAGPGSEVMLDEFVYAGGADTQKMVIGLTKGIMRFVSGKMPSKAYEVNTPGAIIGVRGTDFLVRVSSIGRTEVLVQRGRITVRDADGGGEVTCGESQATSVAPPGTPQPPSPPGPPSPEMTADEFELTVIQAINDTPATAAPVSLLELAKRKRIADRAREMGMASQTSSGCGGC
jgi:ferric-dicitrate binding protein FerR (iron transport regulator)